MTVLHNRVSNQELRTLILTDIVPRITLSFYHYFTLEDPYSFRNNFYSILMHLNVLGRVYITTEGISAQISVPEHYFNSLRKAIYTAHHQLNGLLLNVALDNKGKPFWVLRMKVRPYIIADGIIDAAFNLAHKGLYLEAKEVNNMMVDPDVLLVDMRNHYEYEVGHFDRAIEIPSKTFREQLQIVVKILQNHKDKKIIMYCTGGIRCEKASAWMIYHGFKKVYHIRGGVIRYVRHARRQGLPIKFVGKLFVFDERLGERITQDIIAHCHQCGTICDSHTNCCNHSCHLLFIQCPACSVKYKGCCGIVCREILSFSSLEK